MAKKSIVKSEETSVSIEVKDFDILFEKCIQSVRSDIRDNPYIEEALKVLPVGGYRSAIGSFWNAVVDDLRNKIIHRSLKLFNDSINIGREIKTYEDFQNYVNDDQLIDGAYKIGVIGWEAQKVLKHCKETRHIFDGHPKSSNPSIIKVLGMMEDSVKYVLNAEYPPPVIDLDEYLTILDTDEFDRNEVAVENAIADLPEIYKEQLINRLYSSYTEPTATTRLKSNIEFVAPYLWRILSNDLRTQVARRIDQDIPKGNVPITESAFKFIEVVGGSNFISINSRRYKVKPLVDELKDSLDDWNRENKLVRELKAYSSVIPQDVLQDYVSALTHTYVGYMGSSNWSQRKDFYANGASLHIPQMFESFDDQAAECFVLGIKNSQKLIERIKHPVKMRRLRTLGQVVISKTSSNFRQKSVLEYLLKEDKEEEFFKSLRSEV